MRLTKHHGLGNDFLVLLDFDGQQLVDADLARALCDRRTGIGADGLIHGTAGAGTTDLNMMLFNADGSLAEMSGNGIRCLAQAEAMRRDVGELELDILTEAGVRHVAVRPAGEALTVQASVDMGPAKVIDRGGSGRSGKNRMELDMGNPHLVVRVDDPWADGVVDGAEPDRNTEFIAAGPGTDAISMRVIERGVGETLACGTGACAAAHAAHAWGLVGTRVTVHMAGGDAVVELGDTITLSGPATYIATIEV
jgi:diaminopimelate epimerase